MLRVRGVWVFPLCLISKYRGQQKDDLSALEIKVLLVTEMKFLPQKVASVGNFREAVWSRKNRR